MSIGNRLFFVFFRKKISLRLVMVHKGGRIIGKQSIAVNSIHSSGSAEPPSPQR